MNLLNRFKIYLKTQKISVVTSKNYLADINQFLNWLYQKTKIHWQVAGLRVFTLFTSETLKEYKKSLIDNQAPPATINRRLSSLRKFGQFGIKIGCLAENPAYKVANIQRDDWGSGTGLFRRLAGAQASVGNKLKLKEKRDLVLKFKKSLEQEKASPLTVKNYLSDLRHFLSWLETT